MRVRLTRLIGRGAELAGKQARTLPGAAGAVCAVVGSLRLWNGGVALLVAAGFLLLLDRRV